MPSSDHLLHKQIASKKRLTPFDRIVIVVSFLYPLSASPQVVEVFTGHSAGVSLASWGGFLVCATLFFVYGLKHKIVPMVIANGIWIIMDILVIVGVLIQR